jgi:hypothetical protein
MDKFKLGRIVNHDPRSKNFAFDTTDIPIISITHQRLIPILDQGQVGSCTGNAGIGDINTQPFTLNTKVYSPDETGALKLYEAAQVIDGVVPYPVTDNGSSGLSIAKALSKTGLISSYQHTFTLYDALKALTQYPVITGINWYSEMFTPDPDGRVHPTGTIAGGHEVELYRIDAEKGRIWGHNSWGNSWGVNGDFYLTWADYATLLGQQGDTTVLIPPLGIPTVTLKRNSDNGIETLGTLTTTGFTCKTLELSDKQNKPNISCIPKGIYTCQWKFKLNSLAYHYEIMNVPNRSGIFLHNGNYYTDIKGCVLLGDSYGDINKDGQTDILNSKATLSKFETLMGKKDFQLIIT